MQRLCVGGSTGDASVATYNRELVSNKNAFVACEFYSIVGFGLNLVRREMTHRAEDVEEVLEVWKRVDELV